MDWCDWKLGFNGFRNKVASPKLLRNNCISDVVGFNYTITIWLRNLVYFAQNLM